MKSNSIISEIYILIGIFIFGFLSIYFTESSFDKFITNLDKKIVNQKAKIEIGDFVDEDILKIESLFYKLAITTTNKRSRNIIIKKINKRIETIRESLSVLENGGVLTRVIELNIAGHLNTQIKIAYTPEDNEVFSLEAIAIAPKLIQITGMLKKVDKLLSDRDKYRREKNNEQFFKIAKKLIRFYKIAPAYFKRMSEDIRRISYEGNIALKNLKTRVAEEKIKSNRVKIAIFGFIFMIISILGLIIIKAIIEEHKELKRAKNDAHDANVAKSEFLANMSHEIRTPLNAILGFVTILKENEKDEQNKEYLEVIDSSSKTLLSTIGNILDFSKMDTGKLEIEIINFNPKEEFKKVVCLFNAKASEKNIRLELSVDKDMPKTLKTDLHKIKQITSNLISNALKFTDSKKKIEIIVEYKKNLLYVAVRDEGKGIKESQLNKIFEAFRQEDSSTTRKYGGTGLGLSISSALAKTLGGKLEVTSEPNIGSKFFFSIPVEIGNEIENKEKKDIKTNQIKENLKLLLVEDNKSNQFFMKTVLKKFNIIPDIANDGVEAVEMVKSNRYDIILMDENMPNMNGVEAAKRILAYEKEKGLKHTPIVALTANALREDRERFLMAGMDEYLTKPLDQKKLASVLANILE